MLPISLELNPAMGSLIMAFQRLNSQNDLEELSRTVLDTWQTVFGAEAAALLLVNKNTGEVEIAAVKQIPEEVIAAYNRLPIKAAYLATFFPSAPSRGGEKISHAGIIALAKAGYPVFRIWPIRIQEKIIGYITLAGRTELAESPEAQGRAALFLEFIAQAIENAYLIYQLRQQNAHLELMMTKLQNTQNHLKRSEKMALVGQLSAAVAHEIRNPLTIISTNLQLLFEKMPPEHPDRIFFETMIAKVGSVDQAVRELLIFARPLQLQPVPLKLAQLLEQVLVFVGRKYQSRKLTIQHDFSDNLPLVYADNEQLQRVFINLLLNAYHFLPDGGSVTIKGWQESNQPWVYILLSDNGPGIPPQLVQRIFEPFFTTRPEGHGLGLFLVKHVLEEMNGSIEVRPATHTGAEFLIRLPVAGALSQVRN